MNDAPRLTAILAVSRDGSLSSATSPTGMPWPRLQRDLQRFRETTLGRLCLVGRRTYEGLPPLPDRRLVVMTRTHAPVASRAVRSLVGVARSVDVALESFVHEPEAMVIGGAGSTALLPAATASC